MLYLLDPVAQTFATIGPLQGSGGFVTDLAVDRAGLLFATTTSGLFQVDTGTAACTKIGSSGTYPNSLSFVPKGTLDPDEDALVGYQGPAYLRIDPVTGDMKILANISPYTSSGDLVALPDGRAYLTAQGAGCDDCLLQIDPASGAVLSVIGDIGYSGVWGLAYWGGTTYGFTSGGAVLIIDLETGLGQPITYPGLPANVDFWGAGSSVAAAM